jgi:hypothetical protein
MYHAIQLPLALHLGFSAQGEPIELFVRAYIGKNGLTAMDGGNADHAGAFICLRQTFDGCKSVFQVYCPPVSSSNQSRWVASCKLSTLGDHVIHVYPPIQGCAYTYV